MKPTKKKTTTIPNKTIKKKSYTKFSKQNIQKTPATKKTNTTNVANKIGNKNSNAVLITGASSGIGLSFANLYGQQILKNEQKRNFHQLSYLILVARRGELLQQIKTDILQKYSTKKNTTATANNAAKKIIVIVQDLSKPQAAAKLINKINQAKLNVSTLVNNAGFGDVKKFSNSAIEKNEQMIALNITALSQLMQLTLPQMQAAHYGRIINVASIAGFMPGPFMATYFATKAYVLSISIAVRQEVLGSGIHITALCPGPVATGFSKVANFRSAHQSLATTTATQVAKKAMLAVEKNKTHVVPGIINKIIVFLARLLSKQKMAAQTLKNIHRTRVK